jgi:hypothetical protein
MRRILVGTLAALTVTSAWLAATALANTGASPARHAGGPGLTARSHQTSALNTAGHRVNQGGMGDRDCDRDDRRDCGHCPPGFAGGDYCECPPGSAAGDYCECPPGSHNDRCECPPGSHNDRCECPPGSAGGDYCECPPRSHGHHGCEPDHKTGGFGDRGSPRHRGRADEAGWCKGVRSMGGTRGGAACFGSPSGDWFRVAGAPQPARR